MTYKSGLDKLYQQMLSAQVTPKDALVKANDSPGIYAIFTASPDVLPHPFSSILDQRQTNLVYIGKASAGIRKRLVNQELRHKSPATFFRTIGAI